MKVLAFVGSLRAGSYNRALFNEARKYFPPDFEVVEGSFGSWPLFNEDTETPIPADIAALKEEIRRADGIFFVTPEYNRSIPGGLKNMLDWTSRDPFPWPGKKVYVMGSSNGDRGANMSQYDLKRILLYFGCQVLGTPEMFIGRNTEKFNDKLELTDEKTRGYIKRAVEAFAAFVQQ
jgi:chromate reductase, NAD(P)H dehydrogenase (quinone)